MEEEDNLTGKELEVLYEVLFKRIMEIMQTSESELDPFGEMINRLSVLSGIFSFKGMISLIPELIAYAIKYGMMVEKAYEEELLTLDEDAQGIGLEEEQERRISRIRDDIDKLSMYL
ncbi:MAG: hypothetical protein ACFE8B_08265 [Candidatus Hermodarchaeota archaeon]